MAHRPKANGDARSPDESPGLGDLLGDRDYLAQLEQRQAQQARQRAAEEEQRAKEARAQDPYGALVGLARLAGVDPEKALVAFKEGGALAKMLKHMLDIEGQRRGPKKDRLAAERWAVIYWLQAAGHEGDDLDKAIKNVASPMHVTLETYRRSAARFKGSALAALNSESEAVAKARDWCVRSKKGE